MLYFTAFCRYCIFYKLKVCVTLCWASLSVPFFQYILKLRYAYLFTEHLIRLHYSVKLTFICTGTLRTCDSFHCSTSFTVVVWDWTHNILSLRYACIYIVKQVIQVMWGLERCFSHREDSSSFLPGTWSICTMRNLETLEHQIIISDSKILNNAKVSYSLL